MAAWELTGLADTATSRRAAFERDGFVVLGRFLDAHRLDVLRARFEAVFRGEFETGNHPDGWYWQQGTSYPHLPRHMANAWKSDLSIAKYSLSTDIGRAAAILMGWNAAKLAQDTMWLKPAAWQEGDFHQDRLEFLNPATGITFWLTLDDARPKRGTLQYVRKSHRWPVSAPVQECETTGSPSRRRVTAAAKVAIVDGLDIEALEVPAGTLVAHYSDTWHGSDANDSGDTVRRAIGVHLIHPNTRFACTRGGYIYGRYKRIGSDELDDSFFPITWAADGSRTPTIEQYCATGELG